MRIRRYSSLPLAPENIPAHPLILPWSVLVSDNDRFSVVYGQARLSPAYRTAKASIATLATAHWRCALLTGDVYLLARFWFPDRRKRDAGNYRKAMTDALSGVVYGDDQQLADERYCRVGLDRERPRCEVHIADHPIVLEDIAA